MTKDLLDKEIDSLKRDFPKMNDHRVEDAFSMLCLKYFYYPDHFSYSRFSDCFVDGKSDGGIDLVVVSDFDSYSQTLSLIQCKYHNDIQNSQDIIDVFTKIDQTYDNFINNKTSNYNSKLKRILKNKLTDIEDVPNIIEFNLFISCSVSSERKEDIENRINSIEKWRDFIVKVYYLEDILERMEIINSPKRYVEYDKIRIRKADGILKFNENGILVNISSNSLKDLYDRFKNKGLFEQNFRYYIRNKKIDDKIRKSLKEKRDKFWFLNNGIIISCSDFKPDGDNIKLWNFSIVNGCQTTTLIGDYKEKNENIEFFLPCKVVKSDNNSDFETFMSEIAEASNSQKPISDRDLKSNMPEQKELQKMLKEEDPKIYVEIKRGEESKKQIENWQRIKNDEIGQYILSFNLQQPGTARSGKSKIFSNDKIYKSIFLRKHCKDNIIDLLKLKEYYQDYIEKQLSEEKFDVTQANIANNGKFIIIALIGLFIKYKKQLINISRIENWSEQLELDNLRGKIFGDYEKDDFEQKLNGLFQLIIAEVSYLFNQREKEEKTVSNFFKTDSKYQNIIIKHFVDNIINNQYKIKELDAYIEIFNTST